MQKRERDVSEFALEIGLKNNLDQNQIAEKCYTFLKEKGQIKAKVNDMELDIQSYVSMNFWGFPAKEGQDPAFLSVLEKHFVDFFEKDVKEDPMKAEYLLPTLIGELLREKKCTLKVLETHDKWFGVKIKKKS